MKVENFPTSLTNFRGSWNLSADVKDAFLAPTLIGPALVSADSANMKEAGTRISMLKIECCHDSGPRFQGSLMPQKWS